MNCLDIQKARIVFFLSLTLFTLLGCQSSSMQSDHTPSKPVEWHVASDGNDNHTGSKYSPFRTINTAAEKAMPGDTVIVHEGTYREQINLPRGGSGEKARIVYRAAEGAEVIVKGSEIIRGWKQIQGNVWQITLNNSFFNDFNPYALKIEGGWLETGEWCHRGEVYLNGVSLYEAEAVETLDKEALTWIGIVGESHTIITANFAGVDPNQELVEINVREAFVKPERVGLSYITIDGFRFAHSAANWAAPVLVGGTPEEKAAYRQEGGIATRMGTRWIIKNNHITDVKGVGITSGKDAHPVVEQAYAGISTPYADLDSYGDHEILNNHIARCGQSAIAGFYGLARSRIAGNLIEDINHKQLYGGWETAAIKFHCAVDTIVENNLIRRVYQAEEGGAYGIWIDMSNQSIRLSRNIIYETEDHAIYLEMNAGPILVDNNIVFGTVRSRGSQALLSAHNLYIDSAFTGRTENERKSAVFAPHSRKFIREIYGEVQENYFYNDVFIRGDMKADASEQPDTCGDYNLYLENSSELRNAGIHSFSRPSFETQIERNETSEGVSIEWQLPDSMHRMESPWVDPDLVGTFSVSGISIENRHGEPIRVTTDINGQERGQPAPGPVATPGSGNLVQWALE